MRKIILIITCTITLVVWLLGAAPTVRADTPTPTNTAEPGVPVIYPVPFTLDWTASTPTSWNGTENSSTTLSLGPDPIIGATLYTYSRSGGVWNCEVHFAITGQEGSDIISSDFLNGLWSRQAADSYFVAAGTTRAGFATDHGLTSRNFGPVVATGGDITITGKMLGPSPNICDGAHVVATGVLWAYGTNDPHTPGVCSPTGFEQTIEILPIATVTGGSLQAYQTVDDPARGNFEAVLDVTMTATLPRPVLGSGVVPATINLVINNGQADAGGGIPTFSMSPIKVTINGSEWYFSGYSTNEIAIPAGTQDLTIRVQATITGQLADHYTFPPPQLAYLAITVPLVNNADSVICDGSFEWTPPKIIPWIKTNDLYHYGQTGVDLFNGAPACGNYFLEVGLGYFGNETLSPVSNLFSWSGGSMFYKLRYRTSSADLFNMWSNWKGSPNVYLVDSTGNFVMDLYGSNVYDPALDTKDWAFVTGNVGYVPPGLYKVVMDLGYNLGDITHTSRVYYDDVAIGPYSYEDVCSTWLYELPATVTPVPTSSVTGEIPGGTPTVTETYISPSGTPAPSETPRVLPSIRPSFTSTVMGTPRATSTMRASVTPRNTSTPNSGAIATMTAGAPNPTSTPYGVPYPSATAWSGTPIGSPAPGTTPNPDMPPGPGVGNQPGSGDYRVDCSRPTNFWSIAWWVDYERCVALSFITFGPSSQATAVAIPSMFTKYEPFGTIAEASDGITEIRTRVASYPWNAQDAAPGTGDAINPGAPLKGGNGAGPWDGNLNLHYVPSSGGIDTNMGMTSFSPYCQSKASQILPGALAYGMCFVFGLARNIGLTPWMQFFLNLAGILMPIRAALGLVGMGGQIGFVVRDMGGDTSSFQKAAAEAAKIPRPAPFRFGRRSRRS